MARLRPGRLVQGQVLVTVRDGHPVDADVVARPGERDLFFGESEKARLLWLCHEGVRVMAQDLRERGRPAACGADDEEVWRRAALHDRLADGGHNPTSTFSCSSG